ncbi:MAG: heme NO-binding domain-containing protein [Rhodobacteraceae bacterium]|nr:heme NO-binding domain-containing protein [Paracoccaceae bacterium]
MHGLVNCAIQGFAKDTYGDGVWLDVVRIADLDFVEFETMWMYDDAITPRVLDALSQVLDRPRPDVMEDIGTYLVSHRTTEPLRRLLRFGGVDFVDFLQSLDDLTDRARMAVPDLILPKMELGEHGPGEFSLECHASIAGFGRVMMGVLRSMADDYGVLAVLDHNTAAPMKEIVSIHVVEAEFAEGRTFDLGVKTA